MTTLPFSCSWVSLYAGEQHRVAHGVSRKRVGMRCRRVTLDHTEPNTLVLCLFSWEEEEEGAGWGKGKPSPLFETFFLEMTYNFYSLVRGDHLSIRSSISCLLHNTTTLC